MINVDSTIETTLAFLLTKVKIFLLSVTGYTALSFRSALLEPPVRVLWDAQVLVTKQVRLCGVRGRLRRHPRQRSPCAVWPASCSDADTY